MQIRRTPVPDHAIPVAIGGGAALGGALALHFALAGSGQERVGRWRGGLLMDEDFRDRVTLRDVPQQEIARQASDILLFATMLQAAAVDALLVPLLQGDPDLAWQASFAHSMALGITLGVGEIVKTAVGRARPFERECEADPSRPGCQDGDRFSSFYSLHTGMAFASAGFSCSMHLSRNLYDDPLADIASCGASVAMATATGMLRISADRHYLSDVLVGAVLGFLVGYLIPLAVVPERSRVPQDPALADLGEDEIPETPQLSWHVTPMLSAPSSELARPVDGSATDGSAGAQIGPGTSGARSGGGGIGGTIGLSISGTF